MPSIMDLVREYSELELRRNQQGGMLDPQSEIRYQALKFFLEFELFPSPVTRYTEPSRHYEKKKEATLSTPTKEEKQIEASKVDEISVEQKEYIAPEPISSTPQAVEPVSLTPEATSPIQESSIESTPVEPQAISPDIQGVDLNLNSDKAETSEVVKTVEEVIENISIVESEPQVTTPQTSSEPEMGTESINLKEVVDQIDLNSQIESAFSSVIQTEEPSSQSQATSEEVVLEEVVKVQTEADKTAEVEEATQSLPSISEIIQDIGLTDKVAEAVSAPPQEAESRPDESKVKLGPVEELLGLNKPLGNEVVIAEPIMDIEEFAAQASSQEKPQDAAPDVINIDFLSGIDATIANTPDVNTETKGGEEPASINIEEILPADFVIPGVEPQAAQVDKSYIQEAAKAAVHMIDGDARRGVLRELRSSMKEIVLFEDETFTNFTKIPISDIKAIFIMKKPSEKEVEVSGKKINIKFKDDRTLTGISPDYSADAAVFSLYPIEGSQSIKLIIVYRDFIEQVEEI